VTQQPRHPLRKNNVPFEVLKDLKTFRLATWKKDIFFAKKYCLMLLSLGKWQQVVIGFFWRVSNGVSNGSFLCMPG